MRPSNQKHRRLLNGLKKQQNGRDFAKRSAVPVPLLRVGICALVFFISGASVALGVFGVSPANATAGINQEMSFEGKIVTSTGQNIPDGTYNMEFKIYTGCTNEPTSNTGCTAVWTEDWLKNNSQGVTFTSGTYQVNLGAICGFTTSTCENNSNTAVNWNSYPLYLSLQVGNTSNCSTNNPGSALFTADCGGDGEMNPYVLLTSTPYAFNSNELGGLTASQFGQLASSQTWTGSNTYQTTSSTAFQIQGGGGGQNLFLVDSANNNIGIGSNNSAVLQPWVTSGSSLPANRVDAASVTANGYIYEIGGGSFKAAGNTANSVYYAPIKGNGNIGSWTTSATLPDFIQQAAAVVANGYVYLIGGYDKTATVSTVYYAKLNSDGSLGTWKTSANPLPAATQGLSAVTANGYIYALGGSNGTTDQSTVYYAKVYADGTIGSWTTSSHNLSAAANNASAVTANGYVYVLSGSGGAVVQYAALNSDGSTAAFATTTPLPTNDSCVSSEVANGYVYVIGGGSACTSITSTSTVYYAPLNSTGTIGSWTANPNALPTTEFGGTSVIVNGYVYYVGGSTFGAAQAGSTQTYYSSTQRVQVGGSLDLVGLGAQTLTSGDTPGDGSAGGSITAGDITAVGLLQVQGQGSFAKGLSANGNLTVGGYAAFQNSLNTTNAFEVQDVSGNNLLGVDTIDEAVNIGAATGTPVSSTVNIATTTTGGQAVNIASGAVSVGTDFVSIGTGATSSGADAVTVGSTNGASVTNIYGGTGNINLQTNSSSAGTVVKSNTNSATAFQVQGTSNPMLTVDTAGNHVLVGTPSICTGATFYGSLCSGVGMSGVGAGTTYTNSESVSNLALTSGSVDGLIGQKIVVSDTSSSMGNILEGFVDDNSGTTNTLASVNGLIAIDPSANSGNLLMLENYTGTSNNTLVQITNSGQATFQDTAASTTAFQILDNASAATLTINDNNANDRVVIGNGNTTGTTPTFLILSSKSSAAADPTAEIDGAMYYNSKSDSFRCGVNTRWMACDGLSYSTTSVSNTVGFNSTGHIYVFNTQPVVPQNDCQPGVVYEIDLTGYIKVAAGDTGSMAFYFKEGSASAGLPDNETSTGSTDIGDTLVGIGTATVAMPISAHVTITCVSTTSVLVGGTLIVNNNGSDEETYGLYNASSGNALTGSVAWSNDSGGDIIGFGAAFSQATGTGNGMTITQYVMQRIGP